jgi:formylglycine-generating enzyme required for sulfatase activity
VSWVDIRAYLGWLSKKAGVVYRLPSEAEWEYTARAGTDTARPWGDDNESACKYANVSDLSRVEAHHMNPSAENLFQCNDGFPATAPVGSFPPNPFGVHDLVGNVWEVTEDCFEPTLERIGRDGKARINEPFAQPSDTCEERTSRGGSFDLFPWFIRVGYRSRFQIFYEASGYIRLSMEGFRVARSLK